MNICLKTYAKQARPTQTTLIVRERLPSRMQSPCEVGCTFQVTHARNYYLLNLTLNVIPLITCQRCLSDVKYVYENTIELALCRKDETADQLMSMYDCMVVEQDEVNLEDIIADELHLSLPEIPHEGDECHFEILQTY